MDPRIRIHTKIMARIRNTGQRHGSADPDPHQNNVKDPQHCLPHDDVAHLLEAGNDQIAVVVIEARSALLPTILQVAEVEEMHVCRRLELLCFD